MLLLTPVGQTTNLGGQVSVVPTTASSSATTSVTVLGKAEDIVKAKLISPIEVEKVVRKYFSSTPVLASIAKCESTYRQYDVAGNVLRGRVNRGDVGVMQINEKYHAKHALSLGLDLYSLEGNMKYAELLYNEEGTSPWSSSSYCWNKNNRSVAMR